MKETRTKKSNLKIASDRDSYKYPEPSTMGLIQRNNSAWKKHRTGGEEARLTSVGDIHKRELQHKPAKITKSLSITVPGQDGGIPAARSYSGASVVRKLQRFCI